MRCTVSASAAATSALTALLAFAGCTAPIGETGAALTDMPDGEVCGSYETTLLAGQHIDAGSVTINNDDTNVYVTITTDNGFTLNAYHVYLGFGPVPTNRAGAPRPGHFPYSAEVPPGTTSVTVTIPLADFAGTCDDELVVAVHTEVQRQTGDTVQQETGWGDGPHTFRRQWGTYDNYTVCCDDPVDACVYPKWIWRDHADWWGLSSIDMGGHTYDAGEMMTLLWTPAWGDTSFEVAHQVIGAELNLDAGSVMNAAEAADLAAAYVWLDANVDADGEFPYVIYSAHPSFAEGRALGERLRDYNEGRASEPLCRWY